MLRALGGEARGAAWVERGGRVGGRESWAKSWGLDRRDRALRRGSSGRVKESRIRGLQGKRNRCVKG